ncbi:MAG: hypothetical protein WC556_10240 [Candidatus Methanoperedens sp.]
MGWLTRPKFVFSILVIIFFSIPIVAILFNQNADSSSPNVSVLVIDINNANTFNITNNKTKNVPDAFIIVNDSAGNRIVNITDSNGMASMQVSPGKVNITIKAEGYAEFNMSSANISNNTTYSFYSYVNENKKVWKIFWDLIALIIPAIFTLYISLSNWPDDETERKWHAYLPFAGWIISFELLIACAYLANDYNIYFLGPMLSVQLLVPITAFIGVVSYITFSIVQNKERDITELEWKNRYENYSRRIFIGPYIAIIAVYTLLNTDQQKNLVIVVFFAYFVGFYTKHIEGIFEEFGKKFLTDKLKNELIERDVKSLEIVKKLEVSTTIAGKLDKLGINEIDDIIAVPADKMKEIALKVDIGVEYLEGLKEKAKKHLDDIKARAQKQTEEIETMRTCLNIDRDTLNKILNVGLNSIHVLSPIPADKIKDYATKAGITEENLKDLITKAKKHVDDLEKMGTALNLDCDIISKLEHARIFSIDGLKAIPADKIKELATNAEIDEEYLKDLIEKAKTP